MNSRLRIYSDILQLRTKAFVTLKYANGGMRYAAGMFLTVSLIAGFGLWIGLPATLQRPLLVEQIDQASELVDQFDQEVVPQINAALDAISQENLRVALAELVPEDGVVSAEVLGDIVNQAGLTAAQLGAALTSEAAGLPEEARVRLGAELASLQAQMANQELLTPEQRDAVVAQASLTPAQATELLTRVSSARAGLASLRDQAAQRAPQLEQLLTQIPLSADQFQSFLARLAFSPERLSELILQVGLTPEQLATLRTNIDAAPEQINSVLADQRVNVERVHPPLGVRFSRTIHMLGNWLATPFQILGRWIFFGLLLLIVAKLLGGTGTLRQHVTGLLLVGAPLFLFFFTYVPDVSPALPTSFTLAFDYFGRILGLVGIVWAAMILVKSMAVTHEFGLWRAAGVVALTWVVIYVILPVLSFAAAGYILRG